MSQFTIDLPSHVTADEARLLLRIKLYEQKRISLGKAAEQAPCFALNWVHADPLS